MTHHSAFWAGASALAIALALGYYGLQAFNAYVLNLVHTQVIDTLKELSDSPEQVEPPRKHNTRSQA